MRTQLAVSAGVVAVLALAFLILPGGGSRTVTAHFDRAVGVYPGTDLRVMGVQIGEVSSVVPDGNSVRVEMVYDEEYKLPADAKAAVVTPTLVADRYVQVFPAYGKGAALPDGADIPLERTQTPIELDRMFRSLDDLSVTLGPQAGKTGGGALDNLLTAGSKALDGNGELGSKTIRNLSGAAETFARNRGPLFDNVRALAELTDTLAANDATVEAFLESLTSVSGQLEGEREELRTVLASLARVLGTVKGFVHENREILGKDIRLLTSILDRVDREKDALGIVITEGSLAMSNLAIAFESKSSTYGSRVQITPGLQFRPDQFLGELCLNSGGPAPICTVLQTLLESLLPGTSMSAADAKAPEPTETPSTPALPELPDTTGGVPDLADLLGGERR
jgi:phospholipid/cholesterol/gamma-HCH transport system substrate-binding protein